MNDQLTFPEPAARVTDPLTSHQAAQKVRRSAERHQRAIRRWFALNGPSTQAACADALVDEGWDWRTTVSACNPKRSGLVVVGQTIEGSRKNLYAVDIRSVPSL